MKNPERNGSRMARPSFKTFFVAALVWMLGAVVAHAQPTQPLQYTQPSPQDTMWDAPTGPDAAVRENDAGRWAIPIREVMERTYDVSGQKAEWVLGTSILGSPELAPSALGIGSVSSRYPSKLAGIYATRLGYDPSTLTLNGENGILTEERHGIPVDTPITDLAWERGAFGGNALHLQFKRIITDSVAFDLGLQSRSNKDSKEFTYQNTTHSPYFSLGRDSTSIPFGGRNIAANSMHFQPILTWRFGFGKMFLKMNYLSIKNADNTSHKVILDTLDLSKRTFQTDPYTIGIESRTYGTGFEFYPFKKFTISASVHYGTHEIEEDSLAHIYRGEKIWTDTLEITHTDTLYYDTTRAYDYETILGEFGLKYATFFNPALKFQYEFLNTKEYLEEYNRSFLQDREVGFAEISDTLGFFLFRVQNGWQRNSSIANDIDYVHAYSGDATLLLPMHVRLNGSFRRDNKFPDINQLKFLETGRVSFPNENLKYEKRERHTANIGWYSREVFYGLGFRHEDARNLIKHRWAENDHLDTAASNLQNMDSVETAFQWTNVKEVETLDWMLQVGFRLGNWKFYLERGQVLDRSRKLIDTPELYYKGSIHWQNRFVNNRLGVSTRVDWQWFDNRIDCTINELGKPELEEMRHYLALDFEARMQILTFELYSRIENFNHSIYMPESGYTPEGLRFAYGIVWTFGN